MTSLQRRQAVCFSSSVSVPSAHPYSPQNQEDQRKGGQRNPPGERGSCGKKDQVRVKRSHQIGQCVRVWGQRVTGGGSSHKCALSFRVCVQAPGPGALEGSLCGVVETSKGSSTSSERSGRARVCLGPLLGGAQRAVAWVGLSSQP